MSFPRKESAACVQVCKAVYEGGLAGLSAVDYIRGMKNHV